MRKCGGDGLSGDECEEEAAALVSGGFTHTPPQLPVKNRCIHSDGCDVSGVGERE